MQKLPEDVDSVTCLQISLNSKEIKMTNQFTWTSTFKSRSAKLTLVSVFAALFLFGCGGIDAPRIITFGDSTLDEGVEGYKPTIQGSSPTGPSSSRLFSNVVATALGSNELCAFFRSANLRASYTTVPGCTSFAAQGGRINPVGLEVIYGKGASATSAEPIQTQMVSAATALGNYSNTDIVLISVSGNDLRDLVNAFSAMAAGKPTQFLTLTTGVLGSATVNGLLAADPATAPLKIGAAYMTALATKLQAMVKTNILEKGATKVVILNAPKVTALPSLALGLNSLEAQAGATARAQFEGAITFWMQAYNQQLASQYMDENRVMVFNSYSLYEQIIAQPSSFGFTNVKDSACPPSGQDFEGLVYSLPTCTEAVANAYIASGPTGYVSGTKLSGNVSGFFFSDYHPTPKAHQIVGERIVSAIAGKGW